MLKALVFLDYMDNVSLLSKQYSLRDLAIYSPNSDQLANIFPYPFHQIAAQKIVIFLTLIFLAEEVPSYHFF